MSIAKNFGLIDVHLIRKVYLPEDLEMTIPCNNATQPEQKHQIEKVIEDVVSDLNEIVRARVRALGANCVIGYKIDINKLD